MPISLLFDVKCLFHFF